MSPEPRLDARSRAERVLRIEAEAILGLVPRLDAAFGRAVELIHRCTGRVIVTGMGKSGHIGGKIAATLASTGTPAFFVHPAEGAHGDIGMIARADVVIALSNSGETDEMLTILPALKRLGVRIVLMTGNPKSTLASQCEVVLDVSVTEEACPMNLAPTASTTAALAMGDALAMAVLDRRGLRPEDFAALHPGGTLGWRALFRVADLMHGGDSLPIVTEDASLRRVVEEMTRERPRSAAAGEAPHACGMTTVVDAAGRLVGVITDGDLRRLYLRSGPFDAVRAADLATRTPRTIGADDLAAKALEVMEGTITSLVVVDDAQRPRGVIHLHDILRAKIV